MMIYTRMSDLEVTAFYGSNKELFIIIYKLFMLKSIRLSLTGRFFPLYLIYYEVWQILRFLEVCSYAEHNVWSNDMGWPPLPSSHLHSPRLTTCSKHVQNMFMTCSQHVHNMFTTCSQHVHNMPQHVHNMFMTCSHHVNDMFTTCA